MRVSRARAALVGALLVCGRAEAAWVEVTERAEPQVFTEVTTRYETGASVSTRVAPESLSGYHFCYWTVDGIQQRDIAGRSVNPALFRPLAPTVCIAHYVEEQQDDNTNGVPDWWELTHYTNTVADANTDSDGDGIGLGVEYVRDLHPRIVDEITSGGFAMVPSIATAPSPTNQVLYRRHSDPTALSLWTETWVTTGTVYAYSDAYGVLDGYRFTHWTVNGMRRSDEAGRALSQLSVTVVSNTTVISHYLPEDLDADGDGVPDWYEINLCGNTNGHAETDHDGDGFGLLHEYEMEFHPGVRNEVTYGGLAVSMGEPLRAIIDPGLATYRKQSLPVGIFEPEEQVVSKGTRILLSDSYRVISHYHFTHWDVNGVRQADETGRALTQLDLLIQSNTTVTAHYLHEEADGDNDGLLDWYEMNTLGSTAFGADSDHDGDGFSLREEYVREFHPGLTNDIVDGGVALCFATQMYAVVADTNLARYVLQSDPPGAIAQRTVITNKGSVVTFDGGVFGPSGDAEFGYWVVNGSIRTNERGLVVTTISVTVNGEENVLAVFVAPDDDRNANDVPDWFELHYRTQLVSNVAADLDGDGTSFAEEYGRGYTPGIRDEVTFGGVSLAFATRMSVDLQYFPRVSESFADGVPRDIFSSAPPAAGAVAVAANSHPAVGDWDGDGDLDVFVGGSNGVMRVFENAGSPRVMNLVERTTNFAGLAFAWTNVVNPAPALGDWSGDGCADLAVGGGTGGVWLVESPGSFQGDALTGALRTGFATGSRTVALAFGDEDGDGWVDLLVLTETGIVHHYPHTRTPTTPYTFPPATTDLLNYAVPNATGITTADVNEDGVIDVLISDGSGHVWEFHGNGL